jgi:hypothetical protein
VRVTRDQRHSAEATKLSLVLTEIAQTAKVGMLLDEALIPIL